MNRDEQQVAQMMEKMVAESVETYLTELTRELFNNYKSTQSQNTIAAAIATAIREYEKHTGVPIVKTLAMSLLDEVEPK